MKTIHLAPGVDTGLATLIDTRCLVQANSGGGKSWCLRRLLEQSHGAVQHLVLDPEGEFASLRERFDYVLAAKHGGDTAAEPRAAGLLAQRLLELGVSAIVDLYELKAHERVRFVRGFLEALVDAPKKLWHPALVVLDEAHVFCPQQGEAESASAVIDLCTRGRKRGFGSVLATQRLSKLHKDAAAELNNKLIGRTGLDVDVKRAADELGFTKERWRELRELEAGEFFVFGPAMSREVRKVRIGAVQTTHPKAGARLAFVAPPPTDRIRALLPKLSDLPAEQERKAKTEADLRAELQSLRGQLAAAERRVPAPAVAKVREVPVLKDAQVKRLEAAVRTEEKIAERGLEMNAKTLAALKQLADAVRAFTGTGAAAMVTACPPPAAPRMTYPQRQAPPPRRAPVAFVVDEASGDLTGTQRNILDVASDLVRRGLEPRRESVARWLGIHPNGGRFLSDLARLRAGGYLDGCRPTQAAWPLIRGREMGLEGAMRGLDGTQQKILQVLIASDAPSMTREQLASALGIHPNGGRFLSDLAWLRTMGVITERSPIATTPALFA